MSGRQQPQRAGSIGVDGASSGAAGTGPYRPTPAPAAKRRSAASSSTAATRYPPASATSSSRPTSPPPPTSPISATSPRASLRKDDAARRSVEAELSRRRPTSKASSVVAAAATTAGAASPASASAAAAPASASAAAAPASDHAAADRYAYAPGPPRRLTQNDVNDQMQQQQQQQPTQAQPPKSQQQQGQRPDGQPHQSRPKKGTVAAMNPTPAVALIETAKVLEAAAYMAAKRVDAVLIVDLEGQLAGILTDKDVAFRVVSEELDPRTTTLASVMTQNPVSVTTTSMASDALNRMVAGHFRHLPVVHETDDDDDAGGGVVGVLDITKCLYDALEKLDRAYESSRKAIDAVIEAGSAAAAAAASTTSSSRSGPGGAPPVSGSALAMLRYAEMLKRQLSGPDLAGLLAGQASAPPVVSFNDSVLEAAKRMKAGKETAALVFDADAGAGDDGLGDLAGIFTSKDLVLRVVAAGLNPATTPVSRVMTPHPDCVTPDTPVLDALRKMHVDSSGVVEGLVDVLKLTYTTLSQINSLQGESEADGPMWTKFWDASADFALSDAGLGGSEAGRRASSVGGRRASSNVARRPTFSPSPSRDHDAADDLTVFPEDSASRVTGAGDSPARSPDATPGGGATGGSALSALPALFTFKLKDLDTGKVLRLQSAPTSLASLTTAVVAKLGPTHPRVAALVRGQRLSLSYLDEDGDYVHLESDDDLRDAVDCARAAGWARVMLSVDSQRVFAGADAAAPQSPPLARAVNALPARVFAASSSVASPRGRAVSDLTSDAFGTASADSSVSASTAAAAAAAANANASAADAQGKPAMALDSLIAPVLIGSGVALVCAFLLGRAFR
ncbi:hypothetical protein HK405_008899 [Cladochytrium tenue]|nr:hypothetical protein HK405_008899 [Cladochytrium tenue]